MSRSVSVDLPAPGAPVMPMENAGGEVHVRTCERAWRRSTSFSTTRQQTRERDAVAPASRVEQLAGSPRAARHTRSTSAPSDRSVPARSS